MLILLKQNLNIFDPSDSKEMLLDSIFPLSPNLTDMQRFKFARCW